MQSNVYVVNVQECPADLSSLLKFHHRRPTSTPDRQIPVASEPVITALLRLADVPVSIIDTGSQRTDNQLRDYRRSLDISLRTSTGNSKSGSPASAADHVYSGVLRFDLIARSATPSPAASRSDLSAVARTTSGSTPSIGDWSPSNGLLTLGRSKRLSRTSTKRSRSAQDLFRLDRSVSRLDVCVSSTDVSSLLATRSSHVMNSEHGGRNKLKLSSGSTRLSNAKDRFRNLFRSSNDKLVRSKRTATQ